MKPLAPADATLLDLFRSEVETQSAILSNGLLALERSTSDPAQLSELMRAAHSLKGAARIVQRDAAVKVAHTMEDWFVSAQRGGVTLSPARVDALLDSLDLLGAIARLSDEEAIASVGAHEVRLREIQSRFTDDRPRAPVTTGGVSAPSDGGPRMQAPAVPVAPLQVVRQASDPFAVPRPADAALRIGAIHLDRLLGLAGETQVASRVLGQFAAGLLRLKRLEAVALQQLDDARQAVEAHAGPGHGAGLTTVKARLTQVHRDTTKLLTDVSGFDQQFSNLSERLQREVMDCRMRPFADGAQAFPRLVREVARTLGKQVRLEILGEATPVDRMLLERLDAPLGHLLRNAVDHGIERPEDRAAAGKPAEGTVRLEARTSGGKLLVVVSDDGRGIDPEQIRAAVISRNLLSAEVARGLDEAELFEFLFLPAFTLKDSVTEISGRGVGLDVVQTMARQVGAVARFASTPGHGAEVQLHLPLTLSVVRAVIAEIDGEPYAFPLGRIVGVTEVGRESIQSVEGRQHVLFGGDSLGLVSARQVLGVPERSEPQEMLSLIVLGDRSTRVGLVVDRLAGEGELVMRPLDPRLSKVQDISAGALMPDGSPLLVVDVDDLISSTQKLIAIDRVQRCQAGGEQSHVPQKRVLVVDDSLTVRELERKLLTGAGYDVTIAVDGMDGWNAVRAGEFDLVVTDVDMPRMDGIELVTLIRRDARLRTMPVMIISYKDREEDRHRGLEAGADYYLPKASFQDDTLVNAVHDLIGRAR